LQSLPGIIVLPIVVESGDVRNPISGSFRHCEKRSDEAIHSFLFVARWIASRSLSSGAHSRDPLARNDD
jgi:hypothetical protein